MDEKHYIKVDKAMIKAIGTLPALLLSELIYESEFWKKNDPNFDGWFFSTADNLEDATGITRRQQDSIIEKLRNACILDVQRRGIQAKKHFKIDFQILQNVESRFNKMSNQDSTKSEIKIQQNVESRFNNLSNQDLTNCRISYNINTIRETHNINTKEEEGYSNINTIEPGEPADAAFPPPPPQKNIYEKADSSGTAVTTTLDEKMNRMVKFYNDSVRNLPKATSLTEKRKEALSGFLKVMTEEDFENAVRIADRSDFLCGKYPSKDHPDWVATIDFILRPDKAARILAGDYGGTARDAPKRRTKMDDIEILYDRLKAEEERTSNGENNEI